jgi:transcription elongation factor GreA
MGDWKQPLEQFLGSGDASASTLDAEARTRLTSLLAEASASNETEALLQELDARFPARAAASLIPDRAYLRGRTLLSLGRTDEALQTLLPLCEKLEQQRQWPDLAVVADEILQEVSHIDAARYLAKAVEQGTLGVAPDGSLARAYELFPDEHRLSWLMAEQLERRGENEPALGLYIGCLPALMEAHDRERVEEVFLRLEDLSDPDTVLLMLRSCVKLATLKEWALAEAYLGPLVPKLKAVGLARDAWDQLLKLLSKAPADSQLRRFLRDLAPDAFAGVDGILELLARSGILDPQVKPETAMKKLNELLEFAPGYRVLHQGWGAGRIRVNEGDALIIDFPSRPGHRMSLALARNALQVIPADDLRVAWAEGADRVRAMTVERPADVAYLAIRELGGKATAQALRKRLTNEIMPVSRWSTWWRDARIAMEADDRFDLSESFRQTYGIRVPGAGDDDDALLPRLDRRRGIRANLNLLRRFLDQHPQHKERAVRMYTPLLTRWLRDEHTNPEAATAICLLLSRWNRLDDEDLHRSLRALLGSGVEAVSFADEADQHFLIERAFALPDLTQPAILFALGSRYETVRQLGLKKMMEDPPASEALVVGLLNHPEERVQTSLALIAMIITDDEKPAFLPSPWSAALALCRLVEYSARDILRNQALRFFAPNGALARALAERPAPDEMLSALEDVLGRWRSSERFLFPILAFFENLGLGELTADVRALRSEATNAFLRTPGAEAGSYDGIFLTRQTYTRLEQERDHLARELKTTVAQAIQRAREMGDISENAEFDAAKDKQAKFIERIGSINEQLRRATLIGNLEVPAGEIGPGSWVVLRRLDGPGEDARTFWLLGEGDSRFGPEVVSCSAPIGRALLGRKVGDEIELELGGHPTRMQVVTATIRLPEAEPAKG